MTSPNSLQNSTTITDPATQDSSTELLMQRQQLLEVVELFQAVALWEPLYRVLRSEQSLHLRAAAFSPAEETRTASRYIAQWLDMVIDGGLENYRLKAEEALEPSSSIVEDGNRITPTDSGQDYTKL